MDMKTVQACASQTQMHERDTQNINTQNINACTYMAQTRRARHLIQSFLAEQVRHRPTTSIVRGRIDAHKNWSHDLLELSNRGT